MSEAQVSLIRHVIQWLTSAMRKLVIISRNYIIKETNKRSEKPTDKLMSLIFILTWVLYVFGVIWVFWWLSYVTVDSAKWALSTQVQATAAIFGLLIAAMALLWRRMTSQEQEIRERMYGYVKDLEQKVGQVPQLPVSQVAYDNYLKWIIELRKKKEKVGKDAYINLGRLWVIISLSRQYSLRLIFKRYLTTGQLKELSKISKVSKESAIVMWEDYHRYPENFIISMYETLSMVSSILLASSMSEREVDTNLGGEMSNEKRAFSEACTRLQNMVRAIVYNDDKFNAEEVKRNRITLRIPFYFTSLVLSFAIVLGLCILTGIEGTLFPPIFSRPDNLMWAVGIPIGLSIFGIALCLTLIRRII